MTLPYIDLPTIDERPDLVVPVPVSLVPYDQREPMDWVIHLLARMQRRAADMRRWQAYYDGDQPLGFFIQAFRDVFSGSFERFRSNYTKLVVETLGARLEIQGFRFADDEGDADLWAIWQENDLDARSQEAHTHALVKGEVNILVEPAEGRPRITVEDPLCSIVECDPRDRRTRLAGLKAWADEVGRLVVYLYLPDAVYTWRTDRRVSDWGYLLAGSALRLRSALVPWTPPGADGPEIPNPMGLVPLVPILNLPMNGIGSSEVEPITSNQDAINYYRSKAILGARFMGTPQRYIYGFDVEMDPDTGRPKRPFVREDGHEADLWTIGNPSPEDGPPPPFPPQIGQFPAADLTQIIKLIETEVWEMASVAQVPYQDFLQANSSIPSSAEAIKSSEASYIRKVDRIELNFGDGWEEVMRVALRAQQDERADLRTAETIWVSPETRNEAVRTDAIVKQHQIGLIDDQTGLEELGYTPEQIRRIAERKQAAPTVLPVQEVPQTPAPTGPRMSPVAGT